MDKLQWFKFSYADWRMGKIQRCSEITQARFINLCCLYWSKEGALTLEDAEIEIDKEHLDILLSKKIIEKNKKNIVIKFLDEQLIDITETSKGRSKAANVRWERYREQKLAEQNDAGAMHLHKDALQSNAEESRVEEIRVDKKRKDNIKHELFKEFWDLYDYKKSKDSCYTKFKKLTDDDIDKIFEVLPNYIKSTPDKKYRKHPATWLNQKCWEDEIEETPKRERTDAEKYLAGEIPMPKIRMGL